MVRPPMSQTHFSRVFRELWNTLLSLFLCSWVPAMDSLMQASLESVCGDRTCCPEREDFPPSQTETYTLLFTFKGGPLSSSLFILFVQTSIILSVCHSIPLSVTESKHFSAYNSVPFSHPTFTEYPLCARSLRAGWRLCHLCTPCCVGTGPGRERECTFVE